MLHVVRCHVAMWLCVLWITLVTVVSGQNKVARIVNTHQNISTRIGHNISLNCEVENTENRPVQWWFVEHNLQISSDQTILTASKFQGHYTIIRPQGGDYTHWNLQIAPIRSGDSGHYKCQIEGSAAAIISSVYIENDPNAVQRPTLLPIVDFTECCRQENVTAPCLPVCNPLVTDLNTFDPRNCMTDLLKLLKCGADGRNHAPCCRRRMLPIPCLDFCVNQPPSSLTDDLNVCLERATDVIECFVEGQHLLPSAPQKVRVTPLTSHSLHAKWEQPAEKADTLTGYRVFIREEGKSSYNSSHITTNEQLTLDGLIGLRTYEVYVAAINGHGSSLPSYIVKATTLGSIQITPTSQEGIPECCERRGVSPQCQTFLCSGTSMQSTAPGMSDCLSEMDKVFTCMAGERNHTSCCVMRGVPSHCYPVCAGSLQRADLTTLDCFTQHMPSIISCFEEGRGTLPGPPNNFVLSQVSDTSAIVSWEPPTSHPELVQNYIVSYGEANGVKIRVSTPTLMLTLLDLDPSTKYDVKVSAVNDVGSSLPTPDIVFLTYYKEGDVAPSLAPAIINQGPPPTIEECCTAQMVKPQCRPLCSYNTSYTDLEVDLILICESDIGKALMCGAAGSNHTSCCQQREIPDLCLPFCAFDQNTMDTFVFDYAHIACVYLSSTIQQCMSQGIATHPSWPEQVRVQNYTTHTISLTWQPPRRNGTSGTLQYVVRWRKVNVEQFWQEKTVSGSTKGYIIQNLNTDQAYEVSVLAAGGVQRSLPAETFQVTTLPLSVSTPVLLPNLNFTAPSDISECCRTEGVKAECMDGCDGTSVVKIEEVCATDLDKLLRCSADNRDHRPCCTRNNVPEECLGFCLGDGKIEHFVSMLCLSFSQEILTCFHEGYDKLPSSPVDFRIQDIGSSYVVVTWGESEHGGDNLLYDLFYRKVGQPVYAKVENVRPNHNLTGLEPFTTYQIFIVAENENGNSRPSPTIDVWTLEENLPEVHVWQVPNGNVQENTGVALHCISDGGPETYIYWIDVKGKEIHDSLIDFQSVNRSHTGRYTCIADGRNGNRVSKDVYLHVMYGPEAKAVVKDVSVEPERGLTARLQCEFRGFPDHVTWLKHGHEITPAFPGGYRLQRSLTTNEETGVMVAMLEIQNVQLQDYDVYACRGTNKVGRHQAFVNLISKYTYPNPSPTLPTFTPAPKQANVSACCIQKGVQPMCMAACTFDVDVSIIMELPNPLVCVGDLTHLIQCAADGRNHTKCCKNRQVLPECLGFCAGAVPDELDNQHLACIQQVEQIVTCMEEGAEYVPSPPRNVKAALTNEGYIRVWWDLPAVNADKVQNFYVMYKGQANNKEHMEEVAKSSTEIILAGIHSNTQYEVYLEAHNHHGSSQTSNHVYITTIQFTPSAPLNLHGYVLADLNVRLDWDRPLQHPGAVIAYIVYYRPEHNSKWVMATTKFVDTNFELNNLSPLTSYQIKVAAKSSTHTSRESNVIVIKTGDKPVPQKQSQSEDNLGVVLGVVFAILILLITSAVIAFWYFRLRRSSGNGYKESVSFENPGYATTAAEARVSGLPSFAPKQQRSAAANGREIPGPVANPDFKDSSIMRESDTHSDQGYSTLSPSTDLTPASTPTSNTATLDVTQLNPHENLQIDLEEVAAKL